MFPEVSLQLPEQDFESELQDRLSVPTEQLIEQVVPEAEVQVSAEVGCQKKITAMPIVRPVRHLARCLRNIELPPLAVAH